MEFRLAAARRALHLEKVLRLDLEVISTTAGAQYGARKCSVVDTVLDQGLVDVYCDDLAEYDGKLVLGALAIGGPKMKVHKACVRRLFESNDQVLDTDAVYAIAKELV